MSLCQMTPEKGTQHIHRRKGRLSRQMVLENWIFIYRRWKIDFFFKKNYGYKNNLKVGLRLKLKTVKLLEEIFQSIVGEFLQAQETKGNSQM